MQGGRLIRLVLVGTEGEANLGFIARLAANFDVDELYLVSPRVDPASEEARRFAARAAYVLDRAVVVGSLEEALAGVDLAACTSAKTGSLSDVLRHHVTAREFAESLAPRYEKIAVVFGRESVGLTREEIARCHVLVNIPASPGYPVLNLSHAVAIVLYELWQSLTGAEGAKPYPEASPLQRRRILEHASRLAQLLVDEERRPQVEAALRHLLWRCSLDAGEASQLYYFFKKLRRAVEGCAAWRG